MPVLLLKSPASPAQSSRGQTASPAVEQPTGPVIRRVDGKEKVSSACGPCKRAHLACDVGRPCKRCINMGKEDQCEDIPHKKRGRPKAVKPALRQPFLRVLPPVEDPSFDKWRDTPPSGYFPLDPTLSLPMPRPVDPGLTGTSSAPLFALFTTTELKILRVSPTCYALTGYHPHEYANSSLLDWLHPSDLHLVKMERVRLITVPFVPAPLQSDREIQATINRRSEGELLSPAEGMGVPFPNQNVRIVRSDGHFSLFNIRLHLGGGLGASLWREETLGRIYLVQLTKSAGEILEEFLDEVFPGAQGQQMDTDFFHLCMNSLTATRLRNALQRRLRSQPPLKATVGFEHPTKGLLASFLWNAYAGGGNTIEEDEVDLALHMLGRLKAAFGGMTRTRELPTETPSC
ncbi:hypothetical protein EHS25_004813 [Saitozyma podzolica]|uniref:Transcription activator of gluconeogenesis ERT1 n=1 Tax=Saitozyma podzolica TaxID=1890683 RepID=A0A427Y2W1_9TREE|nr:hypothetical protein EHS25_004813 [Saitozyma podzolica]